MTDDHERWLHKQEERISRNPLTSWYYTKVILPMCGFEPNRMDLILILILHVSFLCALSLIVYLFFL